jgi:serine/threonine-protein kinase
LELEPELVEAHLSLCWHKMMHDWDWRGAEASVRRALALAPNNADALSGATMLSYNTGRLDESVALGRRAVEQDPLNAKTYTHLARPLAALGLLSEAEQGYRKALELSPDGVPFRLLLAMNLERQGRHDEAMAEAMQEKAQWARLTALAILHFTGGNVAESDKALQELIETGEDTSAYQIAQAYAVRGDADSAFRWLEQGYVQRDSGLAVMKSSWMFEQIHRDPRWGAFLKKMGLAD